jgi:hypothetical protein
MITTTGKGPSPWLGAAIKPFSRTGMWRKRLSSGKRACRMVASPRLYSMAAGWAAGASIGTGGSGAGVTTIGGATQATARSKAQMGNRDRTIGLIMVNLSSISAAILAHAKAQRPQRKADPLGVLGVFA